VKSVQN
jgi:hypothetical protein